MKVSKNSLFVSLAIIAVVFSLFLVMPVSAGMQVSGAKIMDTVTPGDVVNYKVTVSSGESDPAMDIILSLGGFGNVPDGSYVFLPPENDTMQYSARSFIALDQDLIHLNPGESETVLVTVTVPGDVGSGGRYALIYVKNEPQKDEGVAYTTAVKIPVMLTISDTEIKKTGTISDISVGEITAGQPLAILTTFENTGNHHYYGAQSSVELRDQDGSVVAAAQNEPAGAAIIPRNSVVFSTNICDALNAGTYTVISKVVLDNTTVLAEKSEIFEVSEEYIPPFADCSVTVMPGSPTELVTSDGRCSISFPQGAVFGDTEVSLKAVAKDALPRETTGVKLGTTSFSVKGVSGLLNKDATLMVKYSEDDLAVAQGKASLLKLGFYNEAENRWEAMPTEVNENEMTLTTKTNHFSTWSTLVASGENESGTGSQEATPLSPILSLVAVLVVAIGFRMRRER